jgi:hypothetical protein
VTAPPGQPTSGESAPAGAKSEPVAEVEAAVTDPPFYVPSSVDRLLGDVLVDFGNRFTWGTRIFIGWVVAVVGTGTGLYAWVAARRDASTAFDVITQHLSPMGSNLGVAGVLLGIFGYFLAPAMVGAVVGGLYTANAAMSGKRVGKTAASIAKKGQRGPGKIHRALNKVKLGRRS